jgi:PAS domain S-box-containing protein
MANSQIHKSQIRFFIRVILPGIMAFFLFATLILGYLIPGFEKAMMERKQETIRELTRSAWSILEHYHRLETSGLIPQAEAQTLARNAVKELRYGDEAKDYFWITDRHPLMIMHPYRPDLDGEDLTEFRDPEGKAMFVAFVQATNQSGEGFVDYRWQWKDDSLRIVPKLSYVKLFEPWEWIIGTGIYIEDVRMEIRRMETRAVLISGGIGLLIIILLIIITRQSHRIEISRRKAEQELLDSRERYKALAEAASEGVLIWSGRGIHANRTLLSWLNFEEEELAGYTLGQLIPDAGLERFASPENLFEELAARMYLECSLVGKNDHTLAVHADFSRIQLVGEEAVMMVARPLQVSHDLISVPFSDELLDHSETGFYRTTSSKKGRLIKVNEQLVKLLGLENQEAGLETFDTYFLDIKEYRLYLSILEEKGSVKDLPVRIRRNDGKVAWVIINALSMDDIQGEKWFEGSMDLISWEGTTPVLPVNELSDQNFAVQASDGAVPGVRVFDDLKDIWTGSPDHLLQRISVAPTADELKEEYLTSTRLAGSLIEGQADPWLIVRFISRVADQICKRALELILENADPPPVGFAVMQLGSAGRGEQTLATDQDNAIIFADVPDEKFNEVHSYFTDLGSRMNTMLDQIGYQRCKGDVMAGNPRWCQPLEKWKTYFTKWTRNPGPDELLEMSIFFDFAYTAGDPSLVEALREFISRDLRTNEIYFHHMAAAWKPFAPDRHYSWKNPVNLKKLQMPLTGMVRLYALRHSIGEQGAMEKCIGLFKTGVFSKEMLHGTIQAWKTLMKLRLEAQQRRIVEKSQPDNFLDPAWVDPELEYLLDKTLQNLENLMLMAANDFHTHQDG